VLRCVPGHLDEDLLGYQELLFPEFLEGSLQILVRLRAVKARELPEPLAEKSLRVSGVVLRRRSELVEWPGEVSPRLPGGL
jgi:hypothetical protein